MRIEKIEFSDLISGYVKEYGGKDSYCLLNDIEKKNRFEDYGRSVLKSFGIK